MVNFEEELNSIKSKGAAIEAEVNKLKEQFQEFSKEADGATDSILVKVQKSSVSWLIVLGYSFGVFTLGAVFF